MTVLKDLDDIEQQMTMRARVTRRGTKTGKGWANPANLGKKMPFAAAKRSIRRRGVKITLAGDA